MHNLLLILSLFFQGNPTYLVKNKDLTIYTEIHQDKTILTVVETLTGEFKTRTAAYIVKSMTPNHGGIEFDLGGGQKMYLPKDTYQLGIITEQHKEGMTCIVFDRIGILFSGLLDDFLKQEQWNKQELTYPQNKL